MHVEAASGIVLLVCAMIALVLANSSFSENYLAFWKTKVGFQFGGLEMVHSLQHWINDGLMVIFFFVVGLEVKREMVIGELRELRQAALPIAAAIGGMIVPAGIYLALQGGRPAAAGWGIPMATDIAFVVGCMALLGPRVPHSFRVFLLSLAIVDDIGAILVIAIGYSAGLNWTALLLGFLGVGVAFGFYRVGIHGPLPHATLGVLVWLAFHESGVHATIAGVLLGLITPTRALVSESVLSGVLDRASEVIHGGECSRPGHRAQKTQLIQRAVRETVPPVEYLEGTLHPWVGFVIMPVFALANAGVPFALGDVIDGVALAVAAGLLLGKPLGIVTASWVALRLGVTRLPQGINWWGMIGGGMLAGIGFTMALFIAGLALDGEVLANAKVGVLGASFLAAFAGMGILVCAMRAQRSAGAVSS